MIDRRESGRRGDILMERGQTKVMILTVLSFFFSFSFSCLPITVTDSTKSTL